ncbi:MAG: alkane 1-monooxygenase [Bacteroidetes bacterium MedPE-SWsnd-G2]|nr:MAG: alkane 1-monooxygenase [Bacteroidetes bacterium MedPE-SWsnd-G2]
MSDLKYLSALSIPIIAIIGISFHGIYSFMTPIYTFGFIPLLELILPKNNSNIPKQQQESKLKNKLFDWLLYFNIPLVYSLIALTISQLSTTLLSTPELIGITLSLGIVLSVNGINVAHELGHRKQKFEQVFAKLLLFPSFYMHFFIEHNYGHHLNAATPEDPATAKYKQSVYHFWFTSITKQYLSAWHIQNHILKRQNLKFWSPKNNMFWFSIIQISALFIAFLLVSKLVFIVLVCAAIVSFLLLETVNYIEHYGLLRLKTKSGRYERVQKKHSWNSDHIVGRIVLYELTRHSDHHYKTTKKYQILESHEESPQLPFGYPTSMVLALCPPLWFKIMNKRVPKSMILS